MLPRRTFLRWLPLLAAPVAMLPPSPAAAAGPMTLRLRGTDYLHRWSKDGQHEFTPADQPDLQAWRDMLTINVHRGAATGEQLAEVANRVVGNYQRHGRILRTDSRPRTAQQPAEHFVAAALGDPRFIEAVFARFVLRDGVGLVLVASHREYGAKAGPAASAWLGANGVAMEDALRAWTQWPGAAELDKLPARSA
ncbi:hypothetical protein [Aquabacterium humicola]|uniref:hypothetical protein n=1 Tax=Aquabacterium humicola TaxID=3237377 RepID=UPI00254320FF|nr:hypothetical protein [Rubrivivax pictus]